MAGTYDWNVAQQLHSVPFDALIFAAALKADNQNKERLLIGFPELMAEASAHYKGTYETEISKVQRLHKAEMNCACEGNYVCTYHRMSAQAQHEFDENPNDIDKY
jgi:hypothetical protein